MQEKVVEIEGLSKSFGDNHVLRHIDLELNKGDNIAIIGKSGIGKSVLTKCIIRLIYPDAGKVMVLGKDVPELEPSELNDLRKRVGYLFQSSALYDSMTVRENLEFPIRRTQYAKKSAEVNDMVEEALESVGLTEAIDKMPSELSGGMRKRVGLARTLILKPEIILYDEPTTGLDPVTSSGISELIMSIQEKYNNSSIIITHDLKCAQITSSEIKLLKNGTFYASGTFNELKKSTDKEIRAYFY